MIVLAGSDFELLLRKSQHVAALLRFALSDGQLLFALTKVQGGTVNLPLEKLTFLLLLSNKLIVALGHHLELLL